MIEYLAQATPNNVPAEGEPFFAMIDGHRVKLVLQYRYDRVPQETPAVVHYASGKIVATVAMMHAKKLAYGAMRGRKAPSDRELAKDVLKDLAAKVGEARIYAVMNSAEVINK